MKSINKIVIHCSDTPNSREHNAADIHRWHLQNGWPGIGYHYVIKLSGVTERGRPEYWQGAHVRGHNHDSIGICLIGRDKFTDEQYRSLQSLLESLLVKYKDAQVFGHYELDSRKTCPNFNVPSWLLSHGFE